MQVIKEIFETDNGFGYKVIINGSPSVVQEFKPRAEGFQPMTEQEASEYADNEIWELTQPHITISTDKSQIIANGTDTATITAQVDDPNSTEAINFYINGQLVSSENAINGVETIQINATETGEIVVEAESTTKYGRNLITIEAVSV